MNVVYTVKPIGWTAKMQNPSGIALEMFSK